MPKQATHDIRTILRAFELAGDLTSQREITHVKETELRPGSKLSDFVYGKQRYFILIDTSADDDEEYILEQIQSVEPEIRGRQLHNPKDTIVTFGMPFKGKDAYLFEVTTGKKRLDIELSDRFKDLSRSTIQKYIKGGYVLVEGDVVKQPKYEVTETTDIAMIPPEKNDYSEQELPIIYIDDDVIVVNKPAGVLTHAKGVMNDEFTVAEFFRRYTTNALETNRPGIVHRLDRDTSGVIIGARHDAAATLLKKQFSDRKAKKEYMAVVSGVPKTTKAVIDLPIGRNPSAPSTFRVDPSGKPALTTYEVIASNDRESLLHLWPKTGRTHQLRVHMQYINVPILGDRVYGSTKADRLYLHAMSLEITLPNGKRETFAAKPPATFTDRFKEALHARAGA